jgi:non-heme chloroperoxidase
MGFVTTGDGTDIYFKDRGAGPPVVLSGWPPSSDSREAQMLLLAENGCCRIAHDRRGHGRSSQPWDGNEMDSYADDLAAVIEALDLRGVTLIGFSTGGGEFAQGAGRRRPAGIRKRDPRKVRQ